MRRKRRHVDRAVMEQVIDDGENHLMAGESERKFENVNKDLATRNELEAPQSVGVPLAAMESSRGSTLDLASRGVDLPRQQQTKQGTVNLARRLLKRTSSIGSGSDIEGQVKKFNLGRDSC